MDDIVSTLLSGAPAVLGSVSPGPGHYYHIPGFLSRRGVVDVGLKCVHSCQGCFYVKQDDPAGPFDFMRHAPWRPTGQLVEQVDAMAAAGFLAFDVTGGEPILHPGIVEIVRRGAALGMAPRIITLGQFLDREKDGVTLLDRLLSAGLADFRFSFHASDPGIFHAYTGADLAKLTGAMDRCDALGFQYATNATVTRHNYRHLPDLARAMVKRGIYNATFLYMMAHYEWAAVADDDLRVAYDAVRPFMREAVDILEGRGIPVTLRYAPQCTVAGMERNHVGIVGVRYDPHEWMNAVRHGGPGGGGVEGARIAAVPGEPSPGSRLMGARGEVGGHPIVAVRGSDPNAIAKLFPAQCGVCQGRDVCDGVDAAYIAKHGVAGLVPYLEPRGNPLDGDRLAYHAAHVVKLRADADVGAETARLLGRAGLRPIAMTDRPLVSVVVTNWNNAAFIGQCLSSVDGQSYPNIEVIVVDDASDDGSHDAIMAWGAGRDLGPRFLYIGRDRNAGQPSIVRRQGIDHAQGDLIMCLDGDDWLEQAYIEECVAALKANPLAHVAYTAIRCVEEDGAFREYWHTRPYDAGALVMQNYINCCALFTREAYAATAGYRDNVRGCEDWNLWVEMAAAGYFGVAVMRPLMNYRRRAAGIFESDVVPNFETKRRQVILNVPHAYPPVMVGQARAGLVVERRAE